MRPFELIRTVAQDAAARGEGRELAIIEYAKAVLGNGLGHYQAALTAAREVKYFAIKAFSKTSGR